MRWLSLLLVLLALATPGSAQTFTDRWSSAGFQAAEASQGVALGDFDQNGTVDVFTTSIFIDNPIPGFPDLGGPDRCYVNSGSASFTDRAPALGLDDDGQGQGAAWGDLDNDGALDLYVVRGLQQALAQSHLLYHQTAAGPFDDFPSAYVSAAAAGRSVCWADYDNDGFLDVFVTNGLDSAAGLPDARIFLFRNNGDGTLTDVTVAVGLSDTRNGHGCAWSDYDNDGDMDLYVANKGFEDPVLGLSDPQPNALYKNALFETGTAAFSDVAVAARVTGIDAADPGGSSFGCAWADYNSDGWMDLLVTNGFSGVLPFPTPNRLYLNRTDGTFTDVTLLAFLGSLSTESSYGSTWGDFDNDGYIDVYVANANVPFVAPTDNDLYINAGPPLYRFDNRAQAAGVAVVEWAQACASADLDGDGYLDIYSVNGVPAVELLLREADNLFMNAGGSNHWLHLDLVGVVSNRPAVGARVTLERAGREQTREVSAGSGFQSMDDLRVEFGLGTETTADKITIRWPSGCIQVLTGVAADQVLQVVEDCPVTTGNFILRDALRLPIGSMFPLPNYLPAPLVSPWNDPGNVLLTSTTLFYALDFNTSIQLVKAGDSIEISW